MEHCVRDLVEGQAVLGLEGHVIGIVGQQHQVVAVIHIQRLDDLIVERLAHGRVLELGFPQRHEQLVFGAVHDLLGGEYDVDQIFPLCAGKGFFEKAEIFFGFLRRHGGEGFIQIGDDLFFGVDVAAIDMADGIFVRAEPAAQLADFFAIHTIPRLTL